MATYRNPGHLPVTLRFGADPPIVIEPFGTGEVPERWVSLVAQRGYRVELEEPVPSGEVLDDAEPEVESAPQTTETPVIDSAPAASPRRRRR